MKIYVFTAGFLIGATGSFAADSQPLSATVYGTLPSSDLTQTSDTIVLTRDAISATGTTNIADALRATGVVFAGTNYSGNSRNTSISMGGYGENGPQNTLILLDGQPTSFLTLGASDLSEISILDIASIEITPGANGVGFGAGSTGGVINILTSTDPASHVDFNYGSHNTKQTNISLRKTLSDKLMISLKGNDLVSDGYRDNSQTDSLTKAITIDSRISDVSKLSYSYSYRDTQQGLPSHLSLDASRDSTDRPDDVSRTYDYWNRIKYANLIFKKYALDLSAGAKKQNQYAGYFTPSSIELINQTSKRKNISISLSGPNSIGDFKSGLEYNYGSFSSETNADYGNWGTSVTSTDGKQKRFEGFIEQDIRLTDDTNLELGVREAHNQDSNLNGQKTSKATSYRLALKHRFSDQLTAVAAIDKSVRFATIDELNSLAPDIIFLSPQSTETKEISLVNQNNAFRTSLAISESLTSNEIYYDAYNYWVTSYGGYWSGANTNRDKSKRNTIRLTIQTEPTPSSVAGLTTQYTNARYKTGSYANKKVTFIPESQTAAYYNLILSSEVSLHTDIQYTGKMYDANDYLNERNKLKEVVITNLGAVWKRDKLSISARISNLFDRKYYSYALANMSGERRVYPAEERSIYFGLNYTF